MFENKGDFSFQFSFFHFDVNLDLGIEIDVEIDDESFVFEVEGDLEFIKFGDPKEFFIVHNKLESVSKALGVDIDLNGEVEVELFDLNIDVVGNGDFVGLNSCGQV